MKLSDGRFVKLKSNIQLQTSFDSAADYVVEIFPSEMEVDGKRKNLGYPFFGEIKRHLLELVKNSDFNFDIAFFEFEAADRVTNENIINWINKIGIGEIRQSEPNDQYFDARSYVPKRYFDGLILSRKEFEKLDIKYPEFEDFKNNYFWLPI